MAKFGAQPRVFHGNQRLHAGAQVAPHAVGGTDVVLLVAAVAEVVYPRVLKEAADDADHADVFREAGYPRPDAAAVAHDQVHLHARPCGSVQRLGHLRVFQRVHLELELAWGRRRMHVDLAPNPFHQRGPQVLRRRKELPVLALGPVAGGQVVEELGQVRADRLVAGKDAVVAVLAGGPCVIVARAQVGVAAKTVVVLAHDKDQLAVRLQPQHAVGHVNAVGSQGVGPLDVGGLVEAGLQLDHDGHLLAVPRRFHQVVDDGAFGSHPVEGHLDGAHLGVADRLPQKAHDRRVEGLVGVMQQNRSGVPDDVEDGPVVQQRRVLCRMMGRVAKAGSFQLQKLCQVSQPQRPVALEHVVARQPEFACKDAPAVRVHAPLDLQPHDRRQPSLPQSSLDQLQQVVGHVFLHVVDRVARDAEHVARDHLHAGKEEVQVVGHYAFQGNPDVGVGDADEARDAGAHGNLDPGRGGGVVGRVAERDQKVERQVGDEGERMGRIGGLGRD